MTPLLPARPVIQDNEAEHQVLPLVRQRLSEAQQCALVWRLLCAGGSQEAGTIGPWIMAALTTAEQQVLATLLARWEALPHLASAPCPAALEELPPTSLRGNAQAGAPAVGAVSQTV
jgi:hypothetical protein